MKADSSSLLYIIISIVLLIISAVGKANKKAAQKPQVRPPAPSPMDEPVPTGLPREFEEIFGKIFQEERPKVPEPEVVFEEAESLETIVPQNYNEEAESLEVIEEEAQSLEDLNIDENLPVKRIESVLLDEQREQKNEILEGFEMRKAIIYAEILNRKYF
jgi:hypothetical protein